MSKAIYPSLYHLDQVTSYLIEEAASATSSDFFLSIQKTIFLQACQQGCSTEVLAHLVHNSSIRSSSGAATTTTTSEEENDVSCSSSSSSDDDDDDNDGEFQKWINCHRDAETGATVLHYICRQHESSNLHSSHTILLEKIKIILGKHIDLLFIRDQEEGKLPLEYVKPYMAVGWKWRSWLNSGDYNMNLLPQQQQQHQQQPLSDENHNNHPYQKQNSNTATTQATAESSADDDGNLTVVSDITESCVTNEASSIFTDYTVSDFTDEEMITHVTSILAAHLEAMVLERRRQGDDDGDDDEGEEELLNDDLRNDLKLLVKMVASMYHAVPYHSFDHAHHVVSAVNDLLDMLVPVDDDDDDDEEEDEETANDVTTQSQQSQQSQQPKHPCSHYLYSNIPLRFASVFAALIHDVDHTGIINPRLVAEDHPLALFYGGDSIAEKNSIVVGMMILMRPEFTVLRETIMFPSQGDFERFLTVVLKLIKVTDIGNAQANKTILNAWQEAFGEYNLPAQQQQVLEEGQQYSTQSFSNHPPSVLLENGDCTCLDQKRATAVLYYIMRSSDVLHLMEDWDTFLKWCKRCYVEFQAAYRAGKGDDPGCTSWYEGQVVFLDGYVAPLAQRLHSSGAFGEFGTDMIDNIYASRSKWLEEGYEISLQLYHQ